MYIRNFENIDIEKASELSQLTWGDFYTNESEKLQKLIYSFMVEYYDLNREYSFSILEDELKGFLLAFCKTDCYKLKDFDERVKALKEKTEQKIAVDLFNYLEFCGKKLKSIINDDDVILGLFVSIKKGCGKQLLAKLVETCKERNMKNIYLWTDTTCDYEYYRKNNFVLLKQINSLVNGKSIKTLIYQKSILKEN